MDLVATLAPDQMSVRIGFDAAESKKEEHPSRSAPGGGSLLGGPVVSRPQVEQDTTLDADKDLCYWTSSGDEERVRGLLAENPQSINNKDVEGRTGTLLPSYH